MIIYRTQEEPKIPSQLLAALRVNLQEFERSDISCHEQVQELLIEFGKVEAAISDALFDREDSDDFVTQGFRQAALSLGHLLSCSWKRKTKEMEFWLTKLNRELDLLASFPFPEPVRVSVPEGYAYYGLYPETYLEAALAFFREIGPKRVVCIGIRSIGTSLSAVVSAAIEEQGCPVWTYTVRPHGHPFHRHLVLSPQLEESLQSLIPSYFLIVDEGPGLSGSSMTCVAEKLSQLNVPDDHIVLFPSWNPDGSHFVCETARNRWPRHRKFVTGFEETWVKSGRLAQSFPFVSLHDVSAGMWRSLFYDNGSDYPPVHPHHERRKYLCSENGLPKTQASFCDPVALSSGNGNGKPATFMIKFAGLGSYGRAVLARARQLHETGFHPPVVGLAGGFLITEFIAGRPLSKRDVNESLLDTFARYLTYRKQAFPVASTVSQEEMMDMIRTNTKEGLGEQWAERLMRLPGLQDAFASGSPVAVDGRMLPHEWLRTAQGYIKTDGTDHHADHFFPGSQDIAWDVAGCCIEFGLNRETRDHFVNKCYSPAKDTGLHERIPFYAIAYLAYRLGYATLAVQALERSDDAERFQSLATLYASLLQREISRLGT